MHNQLYVLYFESVCVCVYDNLCIISTTSYSMALPIFDVLLVMCELVGLGQSVVSWASD